MNVPDLDAFPKARVGNRYEDFTPGQVFTHHWGRTLTDGDNATFSTATCTWLPMYINAEFARQQGHRDMVINPMLLLCTTVGLSVEDLTEYGGPFLGIEDCSFHRPAYPGDTIRASSTVLEKRVSANKPGFGIVSWLTEARNQDDELVLNFRRTNLVRMREANA